MPGLLIKPIAWAIRRLKEKFSATSMLKTEDWAEVPLALRDRAMFSATIDQLKLVQSIQDKLVERVTMAEAEQGRATMSAAKFVSEIRQQIKAAPGDTGKITDIASRRRLELIYDFQTEDAASFARWKMDQDPDWLDSTPAQELVRIADRKEPRNWTARWAESGGQFFDGRMIALKTDEIWSRISVFGRPWPPFDFGSGMGLRDIFRDEAEGFGLINPWQKLTPQEIGFNDELTASVSGLSEGKRAQLKSVFGEQIEINGDVARWRARN